MPDLVRRVQANLKSSVTGYITTRHIPYSLPDNVPAHILIGSGNGGEVTLVTLVAIDGMRLVNVLASSPGNHPPHLAEIERIVRTLRVFEPTLNGRK